MFAPLKYEGGTVMVLPYFAGSAGDSLARGAFLGLTLDTTRQQMFQAIVEGITHEMTLMLSRLEEQGGTPIDIIRACGGPAKSTNWLQLKADISGKTVEAPAVEEASALGAALLAGTATGVYTSYEEAIKAAVKIKATYRPQPGIQELYQRQHEIYKHLVKTLTPVSKELYNIR
jgi:xylulokinase